MSGWLFNHVLRNERIPVSEPASGIRAELGPFEPRRDAAVNATDAGVTPRDGSGSHREPKVGGPSQPINVAYRINGLDVRWDRLL